MFRNFANQVFSGKLNNDWPMWALKTQQVMDACLESARRNSPVKIWEPLKRMKREDFVCFVYFVVYQNSSFRYPVRVRFQKITIIGVGLLGGSIGLAVRRRRLAREVAGFVRRRGEFEGLREGRRGGLCHDGSARGGFQRRSRHSLHAAFANAVACRGDAAGFETRRDCHRRRQRQGRRRARTGIACRKNPARILSAAIRWPARKKPACCAARADLFVNAVCVVTPTKKSNAAAVRKVEAFWKSLGARTLRLAAGTA